jgi:hypothetical protein
VTIVAASLRAAPGSPDPTSCKGGSRRRHPTSSRRRRTTRPCPRRLRSPKTSQLPSHALPHYHRHLKVRKTESPRRCDAVEGNSIENHAPMSSNGASSAARATPSRPSENQQSRLEGAYPFVFIKSKPSIFKSAVEINQLCREPVDRTAVGSVHRSVNLFCRFSSRKINMKIFLKPFYT